MQHNGIMFTVYLEHSVSVRSLDLHPDSLEMFWRKESGEELNILQFEGCILLYSVFSIQASMLSGC